MLEDMLSEDPMHRLFYCDLANPCEDFESDIKQVCEPGHKELKKSHYVAR